MRYRVILFDLDGTLLDTLQDLGEAVNHALSLRGFPTHPTEAFRRKVGHGIRNLVTVSLPEEYRCDEPLIDACLSDFRAYYTAHIDSHTRPYPGMTELLGLLHAQGVKLAIASNKFQEGTEYLIGRFFPGIRFVAILGNRPGAPLKPDPEIVQEVLRRSGVSKDDALLVGDSPTDMKTAANGGIESVAGTWGYRTAEELAGHRQVRNVQELRAELL